MGQMPLLSSNQHYESTKGSTKHSTQLGSTLTVEEVLPFMLAPQCQCKVLTPLKNDIHLTALCQGLSG